MLPLYDAATEQHFFHLYDLLRRASRHLELFVIVEEARLSGQASPDLGAGTIVHVQRCSWAPLRALEMLVVMAWAVLRGHRTVYTHYSTFGAAAAIWCRWFLGARALYWNCEENAGHWEPWRWKRRTLLTKLRIEWPTAWVIKSSDLLVTGTPAMARYYQRVYGIGRRRTAVLANSYDETRFKPGVADLSLRAQLGIPAGAPVALFIHRLAPRKGSRDLPGVIASAGDKVHWLVVGDGPDRAWLSEELARRHLHGRVHLTGNVPNRDVARYYQSADLLVMPSRQEGFPRILLEAQACGLPFVATTVGGIADVAGSLARSQCLVPRDDFAALASRVRELLGDSDLRQRLTAEGLENVRAYSRDAWLQRFVELASGKGECPLFAQNAAAPASATE